MGMQWYLYAVEKAKDEAKMQAVAKSCQEAGVQMPEEVWEFIYGDASHKTQIWDGYGGCASELPYIKEVDCEGVHIIIDLKKIPPEVETLQMEMS